MWEREGEWEKAEVKTCGCRAPSERLEELVENE